eukprot:4695413-Prymnesium_polylepis.1
MSPRSAERMQLQTNETPAANGTRMCTGTTLKLIAWHGTHSFQHCGAPRRAERRAPASVSHRERTLGTRKFCTRAWPRARVRLARRSHACLRGAPSAFPTTKSRNAPRHGRARRGKRRFVRRRPARACGLAHIDHVLEAILLVALEALDGCRPVESPVHHAALHRVEERVVPEARVDQLVECDALRDVKRTGAREDLPRERARTGVMRGASGAVAAFIGRASETKRISERRTHPREPQRVLHVLEGAQVAEAKRREDKVARPVDLSLLLVLRLHQDVRGAGLRARHDAAHDKGMPLPRVRQLAGHGAGVREHLPRRQCGRMA